MLANDVAELIGNEPELLAPAAPGDVRRLGPEPPQLRVRRSAVQEVRERRSSRSDPVVRVLHVASEVAPFAQSGGLADVVAGLPAAQAELRLARGRRARAALSRRRRAARRARASRSTSGAPITLAVGPHTFAASLRIAASRRRAARLPRLPRAVRSRRARSTAPAAPASSHDNHLRFAALGQAPRSSRASCCSAARRRAPRPRLAGRPGRDLRAARARCRSRSSTTIHNLAYRGIFPKTVMPELGIPWSVFTPAARRVLGSAQLPEGRARDAPTR